MVWERHSSVTDCFELMAGAACGADDGGTGGKSSHHPKEDEMPTGYTADIKNGISFETYAMNCARAFGACVTLRDDSPGGDKIPLVFEPSDYHAKAAQKARDELATLLAMAPKDCERAAAKEWDDFETARLKRLEEMRKIREAHQTMLLKVKAWKPPTPDHVGLHEFMRTQIEESIAFDCDDSYYREPTPHLNGDQWAANEAARLNHSIAYHEEQHAKEVERAASRTAWVRALRFALHEAEIAAQH